MASGSNSCAETPLPTVDLQLALRGAMATRWRLFCECSSIRGVQKILRAKSLFIKAIWSIFVVTMTLVLLTTSGFLVADFLEYKTAWHTSTRFDYKPSFPSFTLCSHNPFSYKAQRQWQRGSVMTPLQFQQLLKRVTSVAVMQNLEFLTAMFGYDNVGTYYQHLSYNDSVAISHERSSLFFCVVIMDGSQTIAENCEFDNEVSLKVRLFSYSEFFNCYTVETNNSTDIEAIIVVMSLVPMGDLAYLNHSFLFDVLTKGEGVKVTIHERDVIPDFDQSGFNVEPGRMNEVNYATTSWHKMPTPKKRCQDNQEAITHLDRQYTGNYHQCVNAQLQKHLVKICSCLNTMWPMIQVPDDSVPYCMDFSRGNASYPYLVAANQRLRCAEHVLRKENLKQLKTNLSTPCLPRCTYLSYEATLSITKWVPSASKLAALVEQYKRRELFWSQNISKDAFISGIAKNISAYDAGTYSKRLSQQNSYTYIKIKRKNYDMTTKEEKLTLDVYILLSRIGGLCSLCIGLTAAFFVEMVEFTYLNFKEPQEEQEVSQTGDLNPEQSNLLSRPQRDPWEKTECSEFSLDNHRSQGLSLRPVSAV